MHFFLQSNLRPAASILCVGVLAGACQSTFTSGGTEDPIQGAGGATGTNSNTASSIGMGGASSATTTSGETGGTEAGPTNTSTAGLSGAGGSASGGSASGGSASGGSASGAAGAPDPGAGLGESCSNGADCESGRCADGVCCNEACQGVCMQCDAADTPGTCVAAPSDPACGALECPTSTECREYVAGDLSNNCADIGACATEATCTIMDDPADATCGTAEQPGLCDGAGECVIEGKAGLGASCTIADDCASQHCVEGLSGDSICCDALCDGVCEGCGSDGHCDATPADDDRCEIDCPDSTTCQTYPADPTADRCQAFGQCVTQTAYCAPSNADAGTDCGTNRTCNGSGACELTCPTNTGADRTCTSECPCDVGAGVCGVNAECSSGLVCAAGAGVKFGFGGKTCLPAHCDNDVQDSGETSVDCGGECGCTAQITWFAGSGTVEAISDNGSTIVGRTIGSGAYGYYWNAALEMTELEGSSAYGVNSDGGVIVGAASTGPARWLGGGASPMLLSSTEFSSGLAYAATANGQVIVGSGFDGLGFFAFIWNSGTVTWDTSLRGFLGVSADGRVMLAEVAIGGYVIRTNTGDETIVLPANRVVLDAPVLSRDGTLVVGTHVLDAASGGGDNKGYIYEVGSGDVATVFEGDGAPYPAALANTGLVVGQIGRGGLPGIYWHPDDGYAAKPITELMAAHGLEPDPAITYGGAEAITPNGRVIVGTGTNGKYKLTFDTAP